MSFSKIGGRRRGREASRPQEGGNRDRNLRKRKGEGAYHKKKNLDVEIY